MDLAGFSKPSDKKSKNLKSAVGIDVVADFIIVRQAKSKAYCLEKILLFFVAKGSMKSVSVSSKGTLLLGTGNLIVGSLPLEAYLVFSITTAWKTISNTFFSKFFVE